MRTRNTRLPAFNHTKEAIRAFSIPNQWQRCHIRSSTTHAQSSNTVTPHPPKEPQRPSQDPETPISGLTLALTSAASRLHHLQPRPNRTALQPHICFGNPIPTPRITTSPIPHRPPKSAPPPTPSVRAAETRSIRFPPPPDRPGRDPSHNNRLDRQARSASRLFRLKSPTPVPEPTHAPRPAGLRSRATGRGVVGRG